MTIDEIILDLENIARDAGDNLDRAGEYISEKIREVIDKIKKLDMK